MRTALRLVVLLLVAGVTATPAVAAGPKLTATTKAFEIQISGSHVVDWAYASALDRPNCSSWSVGKGQFQATYETAKKARYELAELRREGRLIDAQWGATRYRSLGFEIAQKGDWQANNGFKMECTPCGPLSEYGPCVPDPPTPPKPSCPKRTTSGVIDTIYYREVRGEAKLEPVLPRKLHGAGLLVEVRYAEDAKAGSGCYPQHGGESLSPLTQPAALVLGANRLRELRRGQVARLHVSRDEHVKSGTLQDGDRCGALEGVLKMNACGRTRIELDVKRVK